MTGISENCGDSSQILENIGEWVINCGADLVHFNCGLHDLKYFRDTRSYQQAIEIYEMNLRRIVNILKEDKKRLIWATTTPVIDMRHNAVKEFDRYEHDVADYNRAAVRIMETAGITINDLHSVIMKDDIDACIMPDGVHMTDHGNKILAEAISRFLLQELRIE